MIHKISHIIEPNRLLLRWQSSRPFEKMGRTHWLVGELHRNNGDADLAYNLNSDDMSCAKELGFRGYPGFALHNRHYKNVMVSFARRLPPRERRDFKSYLEFFCIPENSRISNFALLGYTMARLPSDGFSILHPFDGVYENCEFLTEVAGFRYYEGPKMELGPGAKLTIAREPENKYDPEAIKIDFRHTKIGNVTRGHLQAFHRWLEHDRHVAIEVARVIKDTDHPRAYAFVAIQ